MCLVGGFLGSFLWRLWSCLQGLPEDTAAAAVGAMVGGFPIDVCNYIIVQTGVFF